MTSYEHARAWRGDEGDGSDGSGKGAPAVDAAEGAGGDAECSQYGSELPHSSDTEGEWRCAQCGQCCVTPGSDVCDTCAAEAAFIDAVMQHS